MIEGESNGKCNDGDDDGDDSCHTAKQLLCLSNHRFGRSLSVRGSDSFFVCLLC